MCGILGAYGTDIELSNINLDILYHRGPDGQDYQPAGNGLLGHTRLAIVDVAQGQQPLHNPQKSHWLICNGEIYNHRDIRASMRDYLFMTQTDSEVILALYERYGVDAISHLDGMFAFVLIDTENDLFYMARDPIGIKPLYYGWRGGTLYFASEIKALQDKVDDIEEFPPGCWYSNQHGINRYFDLEQTADASAESPSSTLADIRTKLREAVRKRLMSDVPLGVYLSGGLDSTTVASLVAQDVPNVHSFSVGIEGSADLENARRAAHLLGTQHHEYVYTIEEMMESLPDVIYHLESYDPALVRSAIPNYFLARMTRDYVTVVLTGEGADELYAGYHYLKQYSGQKLHDELVALTGTLYNCNLQRCDRMTMAHSIEGRVPFLDVDFIKTSFAVPTDQKIHGEDSVEKWALRKAVEDFVPENVVWRVKEQFSQGAGSSHLVETLADEHISDSEFVTESQRIRARTGIDMQSKEMLLYYREFDNQFAESTHSIVKPWIGNDVI